MFDVLGQVQEQFFHQIHVDASETEGYKKPAQIVDEKNLLDK